MSKVLDAVRGKYPQYKDIPDAELALAIGQKYPAYLESDTEFAKEFSSAQPKPEQPQAIPPDWKPAPNAIAMLTDPITGLKRESGMEPGTELVTAIGQDPIGALTASPINIPRVEGKSLLGKLAAAPVNIASGLVQGVVSPLGLMTLPFGGTEIGGPLIKGVFGGLAAKAAGEQLGQATVTGNPQQYAEGLLGAGLAGAITLPGSTTVARELALQKGLPNASTIRSDTGQLREAGLPAEASQEVGRHDVEQAAPEQPQPVAQREAPPEAKVEPATGQPVPTIAGVPSETIEKGIRVEAKDHPKVAETAPELLPQLVKDELAIDKKAYDKDKDPGIQTKKVAQPTIPEDSPEELQRQLNAELGQETSTTPPPEPVAEPAEAKPAPAVAPAVEKVEAGPVAEAKPAQAISADPGAARLQGMGGAVPAEFEPTGQSPMATKYRLIDAERQKRGLEPVVRGETAKDQQVLDRAIAALDQNPNLPEQLTAELQKKPRTLSDEENHVLLLREIELRDQYYKSAREAMQAHDDGRLAEMEAANIRTAAWSDKMAELEEVLRHAGTEAGRALRARRVMVNEDFSLAALEMQKRADVGWRRLTDTERAQLQKIADDYAKANADLQTKLQAREQDISRLNAEAQLRQAKLEAAQPKYAPRVLAVAENFAQYMGKQADAARLRLRERLKTMSAGVDPTIVADLAIVGAEKITRGAVDLAKWSDAMVKDLGDVIKPYLKDAWEAAQKLFNTEIDKLAKRAGTETAKAVRKKFSDLAPAEKIADLTSKIGQRFKENKLDSITPLVQRLARVFVEGGTKDLKVLVREMHSALLPFVSDITPRDVMDAFSGYGRFKLLSKGEIDVTLRDLRGQGQQIAKLEDMAEGKAPLKTGLQRRLPSDVERELIRAVNEAKARGNYVVDKPDIQLRSRLQQWKATVEHRIADLEKKLADKDYSGRKVLPELKMDAEAIRLKANLERIRKAWYQARRKDQLANRKTWQKFADRFVRWERMFKLSSPIVFGKLTAAALTRGVTTAAEELVGAGISKVLPGLAARAPREGGINIPAMAKSITAAFSRGLNDAAKTARTGVSDLDVVYGEKIIDRDWVNFFGQLHGMLKAPVKRAEFTYSLEKRVAHALANGVDVTDPIVQTRLSVEALNDGYRSIFMQRGFTADMFNQMVTQMERSKKYPVQGEVAARLARFLLPIVRVPINIVSETGAGVYGLPAASMRMMFHAVRGTLDSIPPETADAIMRQFKKGSIGAGLLAIGYINAASIGGYNWREKRKSGDVKTAQFRIGGTDIPKWATHAPWFELMSFGATIHRTMDTHIRKTAETKGLGEGAWMAGIGLLEETPFLDQMMRIGEGLREPNARDAFLGELAKSTAIPQAVSWAAKQDDPLDVSKWKRKPTTIWQHVQMGVPVLRESVPIARVKQ